MDSVTARRVAAGIALAAGIAGATGGAAGAASQAGSTQRWSEPAEGALICGTTEYTITGGEVSIVEHISEDHGGRVHRANAVRFEGVTLTDGIGLYELRGGGGSGASEEPVDTPRVARLHVHATIVATDGHVVGSVLQVVHVFHSGEYRAMDLGECSFADG